MSEIATIAAKLFKQAAHHDRFIVAIAGPPGAGKSTLSEELRRLMPEGSSIVVPMDGFHFDDIVLERRSLRSRKGAPETFDFAGFETLIKRIRSGEKDIAIPVFDRSMELSRAAADIVDSQARFILVEGNYLLLDEDPWRRLAPLFDFSIFIDVPRPRLEQRLMQRWLGFGRSEADSRAWVESNDLPNVDRVLNARREASMVINGDT